MKPVTLYDVADHAGVSYQTVSRVVNQARHVSAKTREKVEAARRAMLLYPQQLSWNWWDDVTVEIRFWLPAGSFATSVVRELINTTGDYAHIAE